jgi:hypothetical protein
MRLIFALSLFLLSSSSFAKETAVERMGTFEEVRQLLKNIPAESKNADWYGSLDDSDKKPGACGFGVRDKSGEVMAGGIVLHVGDANNDGIDEYILVSRCGGSLNTDTILEVFQRHKKSYRSLNFDKILEKNGLDGSKVPLNIDSPFLVREKGAITMHFKSPQEIWTWKNDTFTQQKPVEKPPEKSAGKPAK